jgi:hypothetical protein
MEIEPSKKENRIERPRNKKSIAKAETRNPKCQRVGIAQDNTISAMTMAECRAIFEERTSERLPDIISKLPPRYITKNKHKIELAIQKAEHILSNRRRDSLGTHSDSVREDKRKIYQKQHD